MKVVFFTLLSLFVIATIVPAHAIPVSRDQANEYFAHCMKNGKKGSPAAFGNLCACTSARVMTAISAEELAASSQKTPEGQVAQRKILTDVFAPCSELIAADMFDFECVNNKKLYELNKGFDIPSVCSCASKATAEWYKGKGTAIMTEALKRDPGTALANPVVALISHPQVKSQNLNNLVTCGSTATPKAAPAPATAAPATPAPAPALSPTAPPALQVTP